MCIHIGSTNVYHIVEKINLLQEIVLPFAIFSYVTFLLLHVPNMLSKRSSKKFF